MIQKILVVDDEADICELIQDLVERLGGDCDVCYSLKQALNKISKFDYDLILTDMNLNGENGLDLVQHVTQIHKNTPIAVMSAYGNQDITVAAMKMGAFDFINKPIERQHLINLFNGVSKAQTTSECDKSSEILSELIGESRLILNLKERLKKISRGHAPVFIHGETGVGKEVVAGLIHKLSSRSGGPFIAINCGAIPENLLESELFGHVKGSFTGATQNKTGLIELANNGTLFLDEIAELPLIMQSKILRAVQEKKIRPVGSDKEIVVDFRVISATHQNLEQLIEQNKFRQDLYYRLNVMPVSIPPLRKREGDVLLLAEHFIGVICQDNHIPVKRISADVKRWLLNQDFPGNVRELFNKLQGFVLLTDGPEITLNDVHDVREEENLFRVSLNRNSGSSDQLDVSVQPPKNIMDQLMLGGLGGLMGGGLGNLLGGMVIPNNSADNIEIPEEGIDIYMERMERSIIEKALAEAHGNHVVASKILKIQPRSLRYRLSKYGIKTVE